MEYRAAILCDYVRIERGIAHIIGANINTIQAAEVPLGHNLGIVVLTKFDRADAEHPHSLRIRVRPIAGDVLVEASGEFGSTWDETMPDGWSNDVTVGINFGVPFPSFGQYTIDVTVDDVLQEVLNLRVLQAGG